MRYLLFLLMSISITYAQTWVPLGTGANDTVRTVFAYSTTEVYAGGDFSTMGGTNSVRISKWNGTAWSPMSTEGINDTVYALYALNSTNVYAGGMFSQAGPTAANRIARWNGTDWVAMANGFTTGDSQVNTIYALDANAVYAGGTFLQSGSTTVNRIAKWNGTDWSPMNGGLDGDVMVIYAVTATDIYVGGAFQNAQDGTVPASRIAKWTGTAWEAMGTGANGTVTAICAVSPTRIYIGGNFTSPGNGVAVWNGSSWSGVGSLGTTVKSLYYVSETELYAGGTFTGYAKCWNGTTWAILGTGVNNFVEKVHAPILKSGRVITNFYFGGWFTTAGGAVVNRIACWEAPTAITLVSFEAKSIENHVKIAWETGAELDNMGFYVWRSTEENGTYTKLNGYLIPSQGGSSWGAQYSHEDFDIQPGTQYFYKLQDIDAQGKSDFHGPISVQE